MRELTIFVLIVACVLLLIKAKPGQVEKPAVVERQIIREVPKIIEKEVPVYRDRIVEKPRPLQSPVPDDFWEGGNHYVKVEENAYYVIHQCLNCGIGKHTWKK